VVVFWGGISGLLEQKKDHFERKKKKEKKSKI